MEKTFITEVQAKLGKNDFLNLRNLYMPILGSKTIILYELLLDCNRLSQQGIRYTNWKYLTQVLKVEETRIEKYRKKLEAVGLLRTFEKADNTTFLFVLNKPLTTLQFKNNTFLYNEFLKVLGEQDFERIFFYQKTKDVNKDDFLEKTVKFYDLFDLENHNLRKKNLKEERLDPGKWGLDSVEKAIEFLESEAFVHYLTKRRTSPSLTAKINNIHNMGFSNASTNLVSYYSFKLNKKVVGNYILAIAKDLVSKGVLNFGDVKLELEAAFESRMNTNLLGVQTGLEEIGSEKAKNVPPYPQPESKGKILDWDELNRSLGEL